MMWRCLTLAVCVTIPLLAQDADPTPPDAKRIQGTWSVVKGMKDGKPAPRELMDGKFIINGDAISIKRAVGTGESPVKYKLDPKKKPAEIDLTPPTPPPVKDGAP